MKKMKLIFGLLLITLYACGQKAQTFDKVVTFNAGFRFTPTGTIYTSMPSGGSMVYPSAGIPISTGMAWGTSIVNNSVQWNANTTWINTNGANSVTAFSWGNHAGLYKSIDWKPDYVTDVVNKPAEVELSVAIVQVDVLYPVLTQTQINALPLRLGKVVINSTDNVMQWCDGTKWNIFITN